MTISWWFQFYYFISLFFNLLPRGLWKADTFSSRNMKKLLSFLPKRTACLCQRGHASSGGLPQAPCLCSGVSVLHLRLLLQSAWMWTSQCSWASVLASSSPTFHATAENWGHENSELTLLPEVGTLYKVLKASWLLIQKTKQNRTELQDEGRTFWT